MLSPMEAEFKIPRHETQKNSYDWSVLSSARQHIPGSFGFTDTKSLNWAPALPWVGGGEEALLFDPDQQPAGPA